METAQYCKTILYYEALHHCRHKTVLKTFLKTIDVEKYKNSTFEHVFLDVQKLNMTRGSIGPLTLYDIASDIFRYHGGIIDKVYIVGGGPRRAVKLLGLKTSTNPIIKLKYATIDDVVEKLHLEKTNDGDLLETFMCIWQKTH
jgi:hypothetical protein